jgi:hypothetical protein
MSYLRQSFGQVFYRAPEFAAQVEEMELGDVSADSNPRQPMTSFAVDDGYEGTWTGVEKTG